MQTYSLPIIGRERYLDGNTPNHKTVTDSRGVTRVLWPITVDVPSNLLLHIESGCVEWVELDYLADHGEPIEHRLRELGTFTLYLYTGLLSTLRPEPQPACGEAYDVIASIIDRLLETARFQSDLGPGKWKTIFSVQLLREEWRVGETHLRRLIASRPHPFR